MHGGTLPFAGGERTAQAQPVADTESAFHPESRGRRRPGPTGAGAVGLAPAAKLTLTVNR